jgi:UDP-glucose 4-epimerase
MRFGRGLDNRALKASGYRYRYTTRETVIKLREHMRLHPLLKQAREPYRYEREVEEFLRWSPSVRRTGVASGETARPSAHQLAELQRALSEIGADNARALRAHRSRTHERRASNSQPPLEGYDALNARDAAALMSRLDAARVDDVRRYEQAHRGRKTVLQAADRAAARALASRPR